MNVSMVSMPLKAFGLSSSFYALQSDEAKWLSESKLSAQIHLVSLLGLDHMNTRDLKNPFVGFTFHESLIEFISCSKLPETK